MTAATTAVSRRLPPTEIAGDYDGPSGFFHQNSRITQRWPPVNEDNPTTTTTTTSAQNTHLTRENAC